MKHPGQRSAPGLLSASIIGAALIITMPAFAETDADRMKDMQQEIDTLQEQVSQMTGGMSHHATGGSELPVLGFVDVGYALNSQGNRAANPKGFYVGNLSFLLSPHIGDNVRALIEPNLEVNQQGDFDSDIERMQIGYTFNDAATVWAGRFHTPYGYWNYAFHHGAQMQTSILRPSFLAFEDTGGILPAHMTGVWSTGKFKVDGGRLTYDAFVGNGPRIIIGGAGTPPQPLGVLDINMAGDDNHNAMAGLNVGYEFPGSMNGLRLAVHGMSGNVNSYADPSSPSATIANTETGLNMFGGSAVYITRDWEVMSEYFGFDDKDMSGTTGTHTSWAGYLQAGRNINNLTPYVRLERAVLDQQDNYFSMQASGQSYARQLVGLRYNLNPNTALKFELMNSNFMADPGRTALGYRSLSVQYAIAF
jgi:hypothetical protein